MISVPSHRLQSSGSKLRLNLFHAAGTSLILLGLAACSPKHRITVTQTSSQVSGRPQVDPRKRLDSIARAHPVAGGSQVISLMLPFRLNQMPSRSRAEIERSSISLNLYQGLRLALDSLSSNHKGLELNVLDTQDDSSRVSSLLQTKLGRSRLVIGPLYPSELEKVTRYARQTGTWFVSPLSPQALANFHNPNLIMVNCPLDAYARRSAGFINDTYHNAKVIIIRSGEADDRFLIPFKESIRESTQELELTAASSLEGIKLAMSKDRKNVLVIPTLDKALWSRLMVFLSPLSGENLTLVAHPGFEHLHFQNNEILQSMDLHFASNYFVDKSSPAVQDFIRKYRAVWASYPDEYAFIGFDIGLFFGAMIQQGTDPKVYLKASSFSGLSNNMEFQEAPGNGYWNQSIKILTYHAGQLEQVK